MGELIDQEMAAALRRLQLARERCEAYRRAYGDGRVDRDLARRLRDALARVRQLETDAAAALLIA